MAIIGMFISVAAFLIFFIFFSAMENSGFLSFMMAAAAITGLVLAAIGYDKSYKISKKGIQTNKDKFKMTISCYLTIAVLIYALNNIFELKLTLYLIYALPYFLAVIILLILTGAIVTLIKINAAKRTASNAEKSAAPVVAAANFCRTCGSAVDNNMKFCIKCGAKIEGVKENSNI